MATIVVDQWVEEDGRVVITGLPVRAGPMVRVTVETDATSRNKRYPTVQDWRDSGIIGVWKGRSDIVDGTEFSNRLRGLIEKPRLAGNDPD